jgi:hypothetical protein
MVVEGTIPGNIENTGYFSVILLNAYGNYYI